jgi:HSP20 family molecular chaperone IbpA
MSPNLFYNDAPNAVQPKKEQYQMFETNVWSLFHNNPFFNETVNSDYVWDTESKTLTLDVPGVKKADLDLTMEDSQLKVRRTSKGKTLTNVFSIPKTLELGTAKLEDGQLKVTFKEIASKSAKKISIE